jgi:hypothetical protein
VESTPFASEPPAARRRLLARVQHLDGRLVLAAALLAYGAALAYPNFTRYRPNWLRLGIPDLPLPFGDMRSLTAAWQCTRLGVHVVPLNPCDPLGWRPANYPSLWLHLDVLGLGQGATTALGLGLGAAFLLSLFLLAGRLTLGEGVVWSVLVLSPAVMLGVNRGNVDLLLFVLVVLALPALARPAFRAAGCALIALAAVLKLFPVAAAAAVVHSSRRGALLALAGIGTAFGAYAFATRGELATIRSVVPRPIETGFGVGVVVDALRRTYGSDAFLVRDHALANCVVALAVFATALVLAALVDRRRPRDLAPSTRLPWLWAGGGLMIGTWFYTENSYDYRLVFALLAVPQVLEWARQERPAVPFARSALALFAAALWLGDPVPPFSAGGVWHVWLAAEGHFPWDEVPVAGLVVWLAFAMLLTLPAWLRHQAAAERGAVAAQPAASH